jgi:superfamily II RNA helicase
MGCFELKVIIGKLNPSLRRIHVNSLNLNELFPFQLDQFQKNAIAALDAGKSVVVCAPTGSGKTLIGEYAIYRALADDRRVFYTTPLKALSNQKFRDFRDRFGNDQVGLLTGDISINRDAPILVMTTEIFRNMLYGTAIGEVGTSLHGVEAVVLDECHYMNDRQRGTVWEESIIYCPPEIQLLALSATVENSGQLTDWIGRVHGPTEQIYSDFRPVPLQFHFCNPKGLFPLLDEAQKKINPKLKQNPRFKKPANTSENGKGRPARQESPSIVFLLSQLYQRDMLPAIYFIFSRRGCDRAVTDLGNLSLVNDVEAAELKRQIDAFLAANPEAGRVGQIDSLYRGIAAHHAGILPAWKGLVEELFQQGLIKVVFATETLAAGINMPARTTVISSLSKRTDRGHRLLTASEFLQMAGRAGRRGMDAIGYVVTMQTPFEGAKEAAYLATAHADPLVSQFTPSYGMVLNLLQTHSIEQARELIERSFGQYLADLILQPQRQNLDAIVTEIDRLEQELAGIDVSLLDEYEKLRACLREERRLLKTLSQQAEELRMRELSAHVPFMLTGTTVTIRSPKGMLIPAVLAAKVPGAGKFPWLICLGHDNRWYAIAYKDVFVIGGVWLEADIDIPPEMVVRPGQIVSGDEASSQIAASIPMLDLPTDAPEVQQQSDRVMALEMQLVNHPVETWENRSNTIKKVRKLEQLKREIEFKRSVLDERRQKYWQEFLSLVNVLQHFGYLNDVRPTAFGNVAAALRGDNELWLAMAMLSGELDELEPHHLATVCAAIVTENNRPDTWTDLGISPAVEETLGSLRGTKQQLIKKQQRQMLTIPVWLEYELVGIVEQWALGMEWVELCSHTSLDEGDVVRILRRTIDLLCQIPHAPKLSNQLIQNAKRAIQLIDRFPVNEII